MALKLVQDSVASLYCKPVTWLARRCVCRASAVAPIRLSMTSNSRFLENEVCAELFAMTFCYELGVI